MTVRELITKLGFKVDEKGARGAEDRVKRMSLGMKAAIGGIIAGVGALGFSAIKAAGDMEMLTTQFEVMLGSSEKAVQMMEQLKSFAANTPFALEDLAKGSQQLLSFGVAEADVLNTMRMLGDTAGGNAEKLNGLVLAYGKVQAKGKASMEEINMLTERGLPIISTLRKQLGATEDQFFKLVSAGKVSKSEITKAFRTMTSEGGMFFEGMKKQSLTFKGLVSTMKDNVKLMVAGIGETLLPMAKEVITTITELVQGPLGDLVSSLLSTLSPVISKVAGLLNNLVNTMMPLTSIMDAIMPLFVTLLGVIDAIAPLLDIVAGLFTTIGNVLNVLLKPLNEILAIFIEIFNWMAKFISAELMEALAPLNDILMDLANIISEVLVALMPLFRIMIKIFAFRIAMQLKLILIPIRLIGKALSAVTSILLPLVRIIGDRLLPLFEALESIFEALPAIMSFFFDKLKTRISEISNKVKEFWNSFEERFPKISKLIKGLGNVFIGVWKVIQDTFAKMWNMVTNSIQKLIGWVNKIPGVKIDMPQFDGGITARDLQGAAGASSPQAGNGAVTNAGRTANIDMKNNINIQVPEGTNTEGIKTAVRDAARSVFTLELKKILVDSEY